MDDDYKIKSAIVWKKILIANLFIIKTFWKPRQKSYDDETTDIHHKEMLRVGSNCIYLVIRKCTLSMQGAEGAGVGRGCYKFFKKYFVPQRTIDLNISWPSNFFDKNFMAPPINLIFSFKPWLLYISGWVILTEIFKALRSLNIHNNIYPVTFTKNTWKQ